MALVQEILEKMMPVEVIMSRSFFLSLLQIPGFNLHAWVWAVVQ